MENIEVIKKYSITKKTGIMIMLQMVLIVIALALSIYGVIRNINTVNSINRIIIYGGQSLTCIAILIFGIYYFNKKETKYFRSVTIAYAVLEALRVSLLHTDGVANLPAFLAKFIIVLLIFDVALLSDRLEKKEGLHISLAMLGLEIILYLVFILGFPIVRTRILYMALPFVGILIAGSMCLFVAGRLEQIKYANNEPSSNKKPKK